jgi:hypothetical protein
VPTDEPAPRAGDDPSRAGDDLARAGDDLTDTGAPTGDPRPAGAHRTRTVGLRARHARRVTPDHVGRRVSLRRWVDDPRRGPVQADVVGRLVTWSDRDLLVVVDREGEGTRVHAGDVVSSRVVPEHPRLPAEAQDAGTRERALREHVVRVLLRDPGRGVLLVAPREDRGPWHAPGTSLARRGDPAEAVRALVTELVGDPDVRVGPPVLRRTTLHRDDGLWWRTEERWHLVDRADPEPADDATDGADDADDATDTADGATDGADAVETAWWTARRLLDASPPLDPADLADRLAAWSHHGPPEEPEELPQHG